MRTGRARTFLKMYLLWIVYCGFLRAFDETAAAIDGTAAAIDLTAAAIDGTAAAIVGTAAAIAGPSGITPSSPHER